MTEKAALVRQTYESGMSVSLGARQHGVGASQLFNWRKLDLEGALAAVGSGEPVVPASELAAARAQISQLQRLLGKKTWKVKFSRRQWILPGKKSGYCARPC